MSRRSLLTIAWCVVWMAIPAQAQNLQIGMDQFDRWIFQGLNGNQKPEDMLESRMYMEIERLELSTSLTEQQRAKMRLAGQGDIKRFMDDVQQARRDFLDLADNLNQNNLNEAYQLALPLQKRLNQGLFSDESLLKKVARGTINKAQADELRKREAQLNARRTQIAIANFVAMMGRQLALTAAQRQQLQDLLDGTIELKDPSSPYAMYAVMYRLTEMPAERYEKLLDAPQLKAFETVLQQGKNMRATLVRQGVLEDE
ncbi:hypothetical protein FYK55_20580 [Roseiconus nitratireducens]|uniref:Uncharacterized protein n=1 Tax=Roseiconus nitratireducens TaxID=2605748 RepID=A0A5M6CZ66_9BACT|nr:hypothetical protein [Roseiconus nitratireducens]KAA5540413.1 hypothetical protein FYK55_20580 [Roseiconus nitratireducens]